MQKAKGRLAVGVTLAATVALLAGCGATDSPDPGDSSSGGDPITMWSLETEPYRLAIATKAAESFTAETGIDVKVVGVSEYQFSQVLTASAGAGTLPDVVGSLPLGAVSIMAGSELINTDATVEVLEDLGADTFSPAALAWVESDGKQVAIPSTGDAEQLMYRKDLFEKAGLEPPTTYETMKKAVETLSSSDMAGIVTQTDPASPSTGRIFEWVALANGCELLDDTGKITIDSKACIGAFDFWGDLMQNYSVPGAQTTTTSKTSYMAGQAAMLTWSSLVMDEMAGLVNDAMPSCAECADDPQFISKNTGFVNALQGPDGKAPVEGGLVRSWVITSEASAASSKQFVEYMMGDGYLDWLSQAPEGMYPQRLGTADNAEEFIESWKTLETGVDTKASLPDLYPTDVLESIQHATNNFNVWALKQGQGKLLGAANTEMVIPKALSALQSGEIDGKGAAEQVKQALEAIQGSF